MKEAESGSNQDIPASLEDKEQVVEDSEDDVEIVEDENGQCTVRIKPKPIKLKIINPYATPNTLPNKSTQAKKRKLSTEDHNSSNGLLNESDQFEQNIPTAKKARQDSESTSKTLGRPKTPTQRDTRTHCDKCNTEGNNLNLVRCDKCLKCYHFHCLEPPVKKSPKIRGYGWHCFDCDEEVDLDWHLDS